MLLEIINVLEFILMLGFVLSFMYIMLRNFFEPVEHESTVKDIFCLFFSFIIIFSTLMIIAVSIFQVGVLVKDVEIEPWVKNVMFLVVEFMWISISLLLLSSLWKNIYRSQLISGEGNVRQRLKHQVDLFRGKLRIGNDR